MLPPNLNDQLLSELRRSTAKLLMEQGFSQSRMAGALGVSQAMVSKYLNHPGGNRLAEPTASDLEVAARKIARALGRSLVMSEARLQVQLTLRDIHGFPETLELSIALTPPSDPKGKVLTQLQEAARRAGTIDMKTLTPQVHINLAMAVPGATTPEEVAAFPGRFISLHGRNAPTTPPAFGASGHLARLLLCCLPHRPELRAICNLRYSSLVAEVIRKLGWSTVRLVHTGQGLEMPADQPAGELLVDEGGFGREPALYVLGADGQAVLNKTEQLLEGIRQEQERIEKVGLNR